MDIQIQSIHFKADQKLIAFTEEKLGKLKQYFDGILAAEVFLRLDKSDDTTNKLVEIKLMVPGNELYVEKQCKSFEEAVDLCCEALTKQVKKYKEKKIGI